MNKYYQILDIPPGSNKEAIKVAYRKKAKQYHPDVNQSPNAHQQFLLIQNAYLMLTDDNYRIKRYKKYSDKHAEKKRKEAEQKRKHAEWVHAWRAYQQKKQSEQQAVEESQHSNFFLIYNWFLLAVGLYILIMPPIYMLSFYNEEPLGFAALPFTVLFGGALTFSAWKDYVKVLRLRKGKGVSQNT